MPTSLLYLNLSFSQNGSVQDVLTKNFTMQGHVTEKRVLAWTLQLCRGVLAFHNKGLVHRDIKVGFYLKPYNM